MGAAAEKSGMANRLREKHASRLDAAKSRRKANLTRRDERKASHTKRRAAHAKARDERKAAHTKKRDERRASRGNKSKLKKGAANKMEHQGPKSKPSARKAFQSRITARKSKAQSHRRDVMSKLGEDRNPRKAYGKDSSRHGKMMRELGKDRSKPAARKAYGKSSSPSARKAFQSRLAARKSNPAPKRRALSRRAGSF